MNEQVSKEIPLELQNFRIEGLFGYLDHTIPFPGPSNDGTDPTVVILHGQNGIGKTTILRMLDGILRLDFNIFRMIPFERAELQFINGCSIRVQANREAKQLSSLCVSYKTYTALLNPESPGPLTQSIENQAKVEDLRQLFLEDTKHVQFDYIDIERLKNLAPPEPTSDVERHIAKLSQLERQYVISRARNPKARDRTDFKNLSAKVADFIRDAQVNVRQFFASTEPELFQKVIERLTSLEDTVDSLPGLRHRLEGIHSETQVTKRYGLETEYWDFDQIMALVNDLQRRRPDARKHATTVLNFYVEMLESRAIQQRLVADRLGTFEAELAGFLEGKIVTIHPSKGLLIKTHSGEKLHEHQLSSGEFHLLYLMVSALVTRRRGTVIAIDEPELSIHIAWQRKLIPSLLRCASKAEPLFILATHSPDLASSFPQAMIELG